LGKITEEDKDKKI